MSNKTYNSFTLSKVKELFLKDNIIAIGDDLILAQQNNDIDLELLKYPCRIEGFISVYCRRGHFKCSINLKDYDIHDGMVIFNKPDNIIQLTPINDDEVVEVIILAISQKYMSTWQSDLNKIFIDALKVLNSPIIELNEEDIALMIQYIRLLNNVINSDSTYKEDSACHLITSIFYLIGGFLKKRSADEEMRAAPIASSRHKRVFEMFIELVEKNHHKERAVGFYADKLCITPKYLSKIIKDISGFSAPDIISKYVILEAQHLLRHSDLSIKEIADQLNFANQSFFYKYFKSRTGITPNSYRQR
ncbi:MAG: helix-turn-helix domain-containing protein [Candidatus Limimorpha sp.]